MTFWDFCAPFYDLSMKANGEAYAKMLAAIQELVPYGASVIEVAAGTGAISIAICHRASNILCTDFSKQMIKVAERKAEKAKAPNITFDLRNIYDLAIPDESFDVVIAGQVLHLIDNPSKAAGELRRVAAKLVLLPLSFTKGLKGFAKIKMDLYKLLGFAPKVELTADEYNAFLNSIGFEVGKIVHCEGSVPMGIAVWHKT